MRKTNKLSLFSFDNKPPSLIVCTHLCFFLLGWRIRKAKSNEMDFRSGNVHIATNRPLKVLFLLRNKSGGSNKGVWSLRNNSDQTDVCKTKAFQTVFWLRRGTKNQIKSVRQLFQQTRFRIDNGSSGKNEKPLILSIERKWFVIEMVGEFFFCECHLYDGKRLYSKDDWLFYIRSA